MTDNNQAGEREVFERWVKSRGGDVMKRNGYYISSMTREWWLCWQARAALTQPASGEEPAVAEVIEADHYELKARIRWLLNPMPVGSHLFEHPAAQGDAVPVPQLSLGQRSVAFELLKCFEAWEPMTCVLGNIRARDGADLMRALLGARWER